MNPYTTYAAAPAPTILAKPSQVIEQTKKKTNSAVYMGSSRMPDDTAIPGAQEQVEKAYQLAFSGRRQASVAALRLHTAVTRNPARLTHLRAAALEWLICWKPESENHICAKSLSQTIVHRLNAAIDGSGKAVTELLLNTDQIARLRMFRTEVRQLMAAEK